MAERKIKTATVQRKKPSVMGIPVILDENPNSPSTIIINVANIFNSQGDVSIAGGSSNPGLQWTGGITANFLGNSWLAVVNFTGTHKRKVKVKLKSKPMDVDTLSITVTSGGQTSPPAPITAVVYDSE